MLCTNPPSYLQVSSNRYLTIHQRPCLQAGKEGQGELFPYEMVAPLHFKPKLCRPGSDDCAHRDPLLSAPQIPNLKTTSSKPASEPEEKKRRESCIQAARDLETTEALT